MTSHDPLTELDQAHAALRRIRELLFDSDGHQRWGLILGGHDTEIRALIASALPDGEPR